MLEELQVAGPESVLAMLRIPGLGPKKAAALYKELKVTTLDELKAACESHRVRELKGFGEKTEQMILPGIDFAGEAEQADVLGRGRRARAESLARLAARLARREAGRMAGSYRRGRETVGDLDFLVDRATWPRDGPPGRVRRMCSSVSPAATRRCRSAWATACRSICASCPPSRSAPRCNTSPARRTTTSCSAAWRRIAA